MSFETPEFPDDLDRELRRLGPLMKRQAEADLTEPNEDFVRTLRNRLTGEPAPSSVTAVPVRPARPWFRRWLPAGGLALSAAVVAVALLLFFNTHNARSPGTGWGVAARVPVPGKNDVLRSYPLAGGLGAGGGAPPPYEDRLDLPPGVPYPGHLKLTAAALPSGLAQARAYRLQGPSFDVSRVQAMGRRLGINGGLTRTSHSGTTWVYVARHAQGGIHSIAVASDTGELLYHDTFVPPSAFRPGVRPSPADVAAARTWLSSLGWPGRTMPLHPAASPQEGDLTFQLRFDWAGVGPADTPAAIIQLGQAHRVMDARLYPPVGAAVSVATRSFSSAWQQVERGKAPVAVENTMGVPAKPGTGALQSSRLLYLLAGRPNGDQYLVPSYRFSGTATIREIGVRRWYAIVPAVR